MKIKRFLPLLASGALLFATSCSSDDIASGGSSDTATVTFTVTESAGVQSRSSFSDGYTATVLKYGVYSSEGTYMTEGSTSFSANSLSTSISIELAKGNSYRIAFWAESEESPYSVSFENGTVTYLDSSSLVANSDDYDAFWNYYVTGTVTGDASQSVTLSRPFAQVNFGTDDKSSYEENSSFTLSYTKVVVSGVPDSFQLFDGSVSDTTSDYTFGYAAVPSSETFPYSSDYTYTAMGYVFAGTDQTLVDAELYYSSSAADETGDDGETHKLTASNVPVQRNYRTNIYGSLLTGDYSITATIDAESGGSKVVSVSSAEDLVSLLSSTDDEATVVTLASDIDCEDEVITVNGEKTLNLNGNTLTASKINTGMQSGADVTIKDGTLTLTGDSDHGVYLYCYNSTLTMEDVTVIANDVPSTYGAVTLWGSDTANLTNVSIETSGSGFIIYDDNVLNLVNCTIDAEYFGISGHGTYPGSTYNLTNVDINSAQYTGIFLPSNTNTTLYNTLKISGGSITSETYSGIEAKKSNIEIDGCTITTLTTNPQSYWVRGDGATGIGYGIVLAGLAEGSSYFDGEVSLTNMTYKISSTSVIDNSSSVINVNIYNESSVSICTVNDTNYYHTEYEDDGTSE